MAMHPDLLTSAAIPATGPDADLIAACNAFADLEIKRQASGITDQEDDALLPAREAALEQMMELRGTTPEAHVARARSLALYQYAGCEEHGPWPSFMLEALLRDMLGLPAALYDEPATTPKDLGSGLLATTDYDPALSRWNGMPWREAFPLYERAPDRFDEWLKAAHAEFPMLGLCEVSQRRGLVMIEQGFREKPEVMGETLCAFIGLSNRFKKMARALEGEAIRLAAVQLTVEGAA